MDWSNLISGFIGAIAGACATVWFQRWNDRRDTEAKGRFRIYMMLLDLYSRHFSIASADMRKELADSLTRLEFHRQSWRIADELRKIDKIPEAEEILRMMLSLEFENEIDRAKMMEGVIDRLGKKVNPRYAAIIKDISQKNQQLMAKDFRESIRRTKKIEGSLLGD